MASRMPIAPIGTLIQKIQCQLRYVVRKPPIGGPVRGPISAGTVSQAMAETSSLRGVARISTRRATGVIIEPPMPCRNRETTKVGSELEKAQAIEPTTKTAMARRKMLVAPKRSAIQPEIGMKMASDTKYDVSASFRAIGLVPMSAAMAGSEVAITVESMFSMNKATARMSGVMRSNSGIGRKGGGRRRVCYDPNGNRGQA